MDWMWGEGRGKKVRERGVVDDVKVFELRNRGVELASTQMRKATDKQVSGRRGVQVLDSPI